MFSLSTLKGCSVPLSVCLSVCLSVPPFYGHESRTATKFDTHIRINGTGSNLKKGGREGGREGRTEGGREGRESPDQCCNVLFVVQVEDII